jgi:hypothetical protein
MKELVHLASLGVGDGSDLGLLPRPFMGVVLLVTAGREVSP